MADDEKPKDETPNVSVTIDQKDQQPIAGHPNIRPFQIIAKGTHKPNGGPTHGTPVDPPQAAIQPPNTIQAGPTKMTLAQRRDLVYQAHVQGASFRQLAKQFRMSQVQAKRDYDAVAASVRHDDNKEIYRLLWERMEACTMSLMPLLNSQRADDRVLAVETIVKIAERQARMAGIDKPVKFASTTPDGERWAPLAATLATLSTDELLLLRKLNDQRLIEGEIVRDEKAKAK